MERESAAQLWQWYRWLYPRKRPGARFQRQSLRYNHRRRHSFLWGHRVRAVASPRLRGYTEIRVYSFGNGTDGTIPEGSLIFDSAGNLYGTTSEGGIRGLGTVFKLSPRQSSGYTETVLHSFGNGNDGYRPENSLIFDSAGNLYGTTETGGLRGWGTVFEMSPRQGGGYTEAVLHSFGKGQTGLILMLV